MKLSLDEIEDWQTFEDLIASYFRSAQELSENNLIDVLVEASGIGSDGGRDILLTFSVNDSILTYKRKWLVQCKFYRKSVAKKHLATVNIPTLIHEYGADGYLLVVKNSTTSKVTEMFENLRKNCKLKYDYMIWDRSILESKFLVKEQLIQQYFPKYHSYSQQIKKNINS
ncbi:MAG: restriction endonuclease [Chitinophagales bacterium]